MSRRPVAGLIVVVAMLLAARVAMAGLMLNAVFVDAAGLCDGNTPCFTTIQQGVNNAEPDFLVAVYPGIYPESVDLSLMNGGNPDDIGVFNVEVLVGILPSAPASAAVSGELPAELSGPLWGKLIETGQAVTARLMAQRERLTGVVITPPADPGAAMIGEVSVTPAAGPAFFHSVDPYPGSITLAGMRLVSVDDDGARLNSTESIGILVASSNGNPKNGFNLSAVEEITFFAAEANDNGLAGVIASSDGDITVINGSASRNLGGDGMQLRAAGEINVESLPPDIAALLLPGGDAFPLTTTNDNKQAGIDAQAVEDVTIGFPTFFSPFEFSTDVVTSAGNDGAGVVIVSQDGATVFRTKANQNFVGIDIDAKATVVVVDSDASGNDTRGIVVDSTGTDVEAALILRVSALQNQAIGLGISVPAGGILVTDSSFVMNGIGVIVSNLGAAKPAFVRGNIICSNTMAGFQLGANHVVRAQGNWWGDPSGPFHSSNNPTGTGNPVVDGGSGGGQGMVDFAPWIDTMTASAASPFITGQPKPVRFQFSGGDGTVFLGDPTGIAAAIDSFPGPPGAQPPFTLTTDNGVLHDSDETAATVREFITNVLNGTVEVRLQASTPGLATVTLTGPCNLAGSITVEVRRFIGAPALAAGGLMLLIAALGLGGAALLRHRA